MTNSKRSSFQTLSIMLLSCVLLQHWMFLGCSNEPVQVNGNTEEIVLPNGYEQRFYDSMRYGFFIPPSYETSRPYPLVIYLHGSTDTVSWDLDWYHDPVQSEDPVFMLTPKSLEANNGWGNSWMPEHSEDMRKTLEVVALIREEYNIDPNRIYVHGASMGGFGIFNLLAKEPDLFAGAYSICGGGDPATAEMVMNTPLWIFHGADDDVVPVELSRDMYQAIHRAGGAMVRYTEYPGVGHAAWTPAGEEQTLSSWLLAQEKGSTHGQPDGVEDVTSESIGDNRVSLSWNPPYDDSKPDNRIWYYRIYRDEIIVAEIDNIETTFTDSLVVAATSPSYGISAVNYFFQESEKTAPDSAE